MAEENKSTQLNVELPAEVAEGTYVNMAFIAHSSSEIIMDFARIMPGVKNAKVKSRLIVSPENAKRFLKALQDNISKYEQNFGKIKDNESRQITMDVSTIGEAEKSVYS